MAGQVLLRQKEIRRLLGRYPRKGEGSLERASKTGGPLRLLPCHHPVWTEGREMSPGPGRGRRESQALTLQPAAGLVSARALRVPLPSQLRGLPGPGGRLPTCTHRMRVRRNSGGAGGAEDSSGGTRGGVGRSLNLPPAPAAVYPQPDGYEGDNKKYVSLPGRGHEPATTTLAN